MNTLPAGQYRPGDSPLHRLDARIKMLCFLLLMTTVLRASSLWGYTLALAAVLAFLRLSRLPLRAAVAPIRGLGWFLLAVFLMNALFFPGEDILAAGKFFHPTQSGIKQGFRVTANVLFLLILGNLLTMTTLPTQVTAALLSLLQPLRLLGVPTGEVAMIISLALQFIPALMEETELIKMAQLARGARFDSKKLPERAVSYLPLVVPVFIAAFRRAEALALAMEARGYRNAENRTKSPKEPLRPQDYAALTVCTLIFLVQFFLPR
ncbi:MAG TPA: energy-coupling factor transporter transmembrane protein EcfT [Capillibacterium sp.]